LSHRIHPPSGSGDGNSSCEHVFRQRPFLRMGFVGGQDVHWVIELLVQVWQSG
jgi:hypothetical protein